MLFKDITCKIYNNNKRRYFFGQGYSKDCQNVSNLDNYLFTESTKDNNTKELKQEFIGKLNVLNW